MRFAAVDVGWEVDWWGHGWNIAHMNAIATCDKEHRLIVPDAIPGRQYLVQEMAIELVGKPKQPEPPRNMTKEQVLAAIDRSALRFTASWDEIRAISREP